MMSIQSPSASEDSQLTSNGVNAASLGSELVLPVATMQRLAFVRYLFGVGVEQSRQPEPLAAMAVLSLHDAVELFLQLAAEHINANPGRRPEFADYFGIIDAKLTATSLSPRAAMSRLNSARVALKHHGTLPSRLAIEQLRSDVSRFFDDNTPLLFDVDFGAISLVDLVACEEARTSLQAASDALMSGQIEEAMVSVARAFAQLVDDYESRVHACYKRSPFFFGESFTFDSSFFRDRHRDPFASRKQAEFEDKLMNAVVALQDAMKAVALGLDYRRYAKFKLLTPTVLRMYGGEYQTQVVQGLVGSITWPPSVEACRFCFDFVIDAAIRLQDFEMDGP